MKVNMKLLEISQIIAIAIIIQSQTTELHYQLHLISFTFLTL